MIISLEASDSKSNRSMPEKRQASWSEKTKETQPFFLYTLLLVDSFSWLGKKVPHHEIVVNL